MIEFYGGYQVYSESGVDVTLLRENLKRTIEERFEANRSALALVSALRESGRKKYPWLKDLPRIKMIDASPLLSALNRHHVQYVLIGGLAMTAHGSSHTTDDLDICYRRTPENVAALVAALSPLQPYLRGVPPGLPFRFDVPTVLAGLNFTFTTDQGDVDVLGEVGGVGHYEDVLAQSEEHEVFGLKVRVLSLDALIASKRAANRPKDQSHIHELEELRKLREASQENKE